jgi:hypothetical protein
MKDQGCHRSITRRLATNWCKTAQIAEMSNCEVKRLGSRDKHVLQNKSQHIPTTITTPLRSNNKPRTELRRINHPNIPNNRPRNRWNHKLRLRRPHRTHTINHHHQPNPRHRRRTTIIRRRLRPRSRQPTRISTSTRRPSRLPRVDPRFNTAVQRQCDARRGETHENDVDEHRLQEFGARLDGEGEDGSDADEVADGGEVGSEVVGLVEGDGDGGREGTFEHEFEAGVGDSCCGPEGLAFLLEGGFLILRLVVVILFGFAARVTGFVAILLERLAFHWWSGVHVDIGIGVDSVVPGLLQWWRHYLCSTSPRWQYSEKEKHDC